MSLSDAQENSCHVDMCHVRLLSHIASGGVSGTYIHADLFSDTG